MKSILAKYKLSTLIKMHLASSGVLMLVFSSKKYNSIFGENSDVLAVLAFPCALMVFNLIDDLLIARQVAKSNALKKMVEGEILDKIPSSKSISNHAKGKALEALCADVFRARGYRVFEHDELRSMGLLPRSGDQGIDLVVQSSTETISVQIKNYSKKVNNKAVQECISSIVYYGDKFKFTGGAVVTNAGFEQSAIELAKRGNIQLLSGNDLSQLLIATRAKRA